MMKKYITAAVILAALITLSGCGKTTSESSNVPEVSSNIQSEPKTEDASESKPEGVDNTREADCRLLPHQLCSE